MAMEVVSTAATYREAPKPQPKIEITTDTTPVATHETKPITQTGQGSGGTTEKEGQNREANQKMLQNAINDANNKMKLTKTKCEFSYHKPTKRVSFKLIDEDTDEVIKEVPPKETLEMVEKMLRLSGLLVDEKR